VVIVLALVVLPAAAGCGGDDRVHPVPSHQPCGGCPTFSEHDTAATVSAGKRFVLELPSNPTTGYHWMTVQIVDRSVVRAGRSSYAGHPGSPPGAGGVQRLEFVARTPGTTTVVLRYARPFEPDDPSARQLELQVTVT